MLPLQGWDTTLRTLLAGVRVLSEAPSLHSSVDRVQLSECCDPGSIPGGGTMLKDLIDKYGLTGKLIKAICAQRGWRYSHNGAPEEWYQAWRDGLGREIEECVRSPMDKAPLS